MGREGERERKKERERERERWEREREGFITFLVTSDYNFAHAVLYNVVPLVRDVSYFPPLQEHSQSRPKYTFKLPHLHVLQPGSLTRNKV